MLQTAVIIPFHILNSSGDYNMLIKFDTIVYVCVLCMWEMLYLLGDTIALTTHRNLVCYQSPITWSMFISKRSQKRKRKNKYKLKKKCIGTRRILLLSALVWPWYTQNIEGEYFTLFRFSNSYVSHFDHFLSKLSTWYRRV